MNIFECGTIICIPAGVALGIYFGSGHGIVGGVAGAVVGAIGGFFAGPIFGLVLLCIAHIECVICGDATMFGKRRRKQDEGPENDDTT